jgi:hypothetical protein
LLYRLLSFLLVEKRIEISNLDLMMDMDRIIKLEEILSAVEKLV